MPPPLGAPTLSLSPFPLLPFANILWDLGFLPLAKDNLRHHPRFPKKLHERGDGGVVEGRDGKGPRE